MFVVVMKNVKTFETAGKFFPATKSFETFQVVAQTSTGDLKIVTETMSVEGAKSYILKHFGNVEIRFCDARRVMNVHN